MSPPRRPREGREGAQPHIHINRRKKASRSISIWPRGDQFLYETLLQNSPRHHRRRRGAALGGRRGVRRSPRLDCRRSVYLYAVVKDAFTRSVVSEEIGSGPDRAAAPTLRGRGVSTVSFLLHVLIKVEESVCTHTYVGSIVRSVTIPKTCLLYQ